jgi:hypothetical protein
LFSLSVFAQIPTYVPANGLVGWWPFNGNANDESGNGNNGNNPIGSYSLDRNNIPSASFYGNGNGPLPGSGMYITSLNNFPFANADRSISVWYKCDLPFPGDDRELFSYGDNTPGTRFGIYLSGGSIGVEYMSGSVNTPFTPDINWHNITVTYDGNGSSGIKLYLDGLLSTSNVSSPINMLNTINSFVKTIGRLDAIYNFAGSYDDIGIWNRVLTYCEIQNLYQSQVNNVSQAISAGADQNICSGDQVTLNGSGGSAYQWNNNVVNGVSFAPTQTATYTVNGTDSLGCSGSDTVMVTVLENAASTITQTALDSYTLNGQTYTQSGTYTQTVPSTNGCDSVITLNLTLNFTGISENTTAQISISPNPASSKIIVKSDIALIGSKFIIYDALGKEVKSGKITAIETEVDLSNLYNGVYLFKVGARQLGTFKIIKE